MKISIITTTYNSADTVADTFESVLRQTYTDIDYWVIDGGSTDGTLDIIRTYQDKFNGCMNYVSERDHGIYDAMNKGIRLCSGDVVGILNSDDYYTSDDVLETYAKEFADKNIDAVYGDIHFINGDNPEKTVRYYSSSLFSPFWLRFGFMPAHPSFYVRKSVYDRYGLYSMDYMIASDFDMIVRLFYKYKIKSRYVKKDFVTMRTGGMSTKNLKHRLRINKEDIKACRKYGLYTNLAFIGLKYFYKLFEFKV